MAIAYKMNKIFLILPLFFISVLLISIASATIILSNIHPIYNQGDVIKLETKISQANSFQGFFRISLFCNNTENLMYFSPVELQANKEKVITVNFPIAITGSCYIIATFKDARQNTIEEAKSSTITLSDIINVKATINKKEFEPKDKLELTGTATKANGQVAQGMATITFDKEYSAQISGGKFSFSTELPSNITPGTHTITITVRDNNNSGIATENITVLSVPTSLAIETNNESFLPDTLIMITPKLLDQANNTLNATVSVRLSRQASLIKTEKLLEEIIASGNSTVYRFTKFSAPGNYIIEASTQNPSFSAKKIVIVEYYEKINIELENEILYISNIGNVPFKRDIEIEFLIENQSTKKTVPLDLKLNENSTYKLEAPKGTYNIKVNTGSEILEFKSIPLTGYVVATIELNPKQKFDIKWIIILIAIIAILVAILLVMKLHKSTKKKEIIRIEASQAAKKSTDSSTFPFSSAKIDSFTGHDTTTKKLFTKHASKLVASSIVPTIVYGTKQEITILLIHLGLDSLQEIKKKDPATYARVLDEYFSEIVNKIKEHQGVADLHGDNLIVLFNVIKQYRHDIAALKTAEAIKKVTEELNQALAPKGLKIEMRAGINTGFANITSIQHGTIKYTAMGDTTSMAKILQAKALDGEILFTEKIYNRAANVIKARKMSPYYLSEKHAINIYSLENSTKAELRDKNQWYIKRALGKG